MISQLIFITVLTINVVGGEITEPGSLEPVKANTIFGPVEGFTVQAHNGKLIDSFLGIPYASFSDRFSPPIDPKPWTETISVKTTPRICYQGSMNVYKDPAEAFWLTDLPESEDCLKLNIWTPKQRTENMTVMVWIHGGGFQTGTSSSELYNGNTLASEEDIVVVSMNYRVSSFGFLYLAHPSAPGNVGLMDQTSALAWIKRNIHEFGGDPYRVTIFGESAGGASVQLHFVLPTSRDLFKRGVIQSGAPDSSWALISSFRAFQASLSLATRLGCTSNNTNDIGNIVRCLNTKEAGEIQTVQNSMIEKFLPVADGIYLPRLPTVLIKQRKFCRHNDLLIGSTTEDGTFLLNSYLPEKNWSEDTHYSEDDVKTVIKKMTGFQNDRLVNTIFLNYMNEGDGPPEDLRTVLNRLLADDCLCTDIALSDIFTSNGNNVFLYQFGHRPSTSLKPVWTGSLHGDELPFLFGVPLNPEKGFTMEEVQLSKNIMRHWTNFAKYGDPNLGSEESVYWPKYTIRDKATMILKLNPEVKKGERLRQCAFWKHVFPLLKMSPILRT